MSTTEARASVDRATRAVAAVIAFDRETSPETVEALTAVGLALQTLLALAERNAQGLTALDAMRMEARP